MLRCVAEVDALRVELDVVVVSDARVFWECSSDRREIATGNSDEISLGLGIVSLALLERSRR